MTGADCCSTNCSHGFCCVAALGLACASDPCGDCAWTDCQGNCDTSGCDPNCGSTGCSPDDGDACGRCGTYECDGYTCDDPCAGAGGGGGGDPCEGCSGECVEFLGVHECEDDGDPIIIDLSGDGFWITDAPGGVNFDFFGSGKPFRFSWTAAGAQNGWLALDRDHDGRIGSGQELFGNATPQPGPAVQCTGFKALALFDRPQNGGNGDGLIDAKDAVYSRLLIWVDRNHNGVTDHGELMGLRQAGIKAISLDYHDAHYTDENGNQFRYRAQVVWANPKDNGKQHWAYDVVLVSPGLPVMAR